MQPRSATPHSFDESGAEGSWFGCLPGSGAHAPFAQGPLHVQPAEAATAQGRRPLTTRYAPASSPRACGRPKGRSDSRRDGDDDHDDDDDTADVVSPSARPPGALTQTVISGNRCSAPTAPDARPGGCRDAVNHVERGGALTLWVDSLWQHPGMMNPHAPHPLVHPHQHPRGPVAVRRAPVSTKTHRLGSLKGQRQHTLCTSASC
jgi:hypothetical protein